MQLRQEVSNIHLEPHIQKESDKKNIGTAISSHPQTIVSNPPIPSRELASQFRHSVENELPDTNNRHGPRKTKKIKTCLLLETMI